MRSKAMLAIACLIALAVVLSRAVIAQQRGAGQQEAFPQQPGAREVIVTGIAGVVAAGSKWTLVWQGTDNADGIVGTADGGVLFAQEQPNRVGKLDKNDQFSVSLEDTHGTGALAIDSKGRILGVERTCTDPAKDPEHCKEPTAVAVLAPERKILADNFEGKGLGRLDDIVVDKQGGVYFNAGGAFYVSPSGQVSSIVQNFRTNGIMLSRDEKTLYVTNGGVLVAFDVQLDGTVKNQRDFGKLEAGGAGDGMAIDAAGRLYVSSGPGVQVLSPEGEYLGVIPAPRNVVSVAFSGPAKKTLYAVGRGAMGPDGKELGNNAKTIYKIDMLVQGFNGRAK